MNDVSRSATAGLAGVAILAVYAVLAGITHAPVGDPTPRIPALLFAVGVPAVAAFALAAGAAWLRLSLGLRAPAVGLALGSLVAGLSRPAADLAVLLLLGGLGWLAVLSAAEFVGRTVAGLVRADSTTAGLSATERAGLAGASVGTAYWLVFLVLAVGPAWTGRGDTAMPGPVEAALTVAFLLGAFLLVVGLPVVLLVRVGLVAPLAVPMLWVGYDLASGYGAYLTGEVSVLRFALAWPAALVVLAVLATAEYLIRSRVRRLGLRPLLA